MDSKGRPGGWLVLLLRGLYSGEDLGHFCAMNIYKQFKECAFWKLSIRNNE